MDGMATTLAEADQENDELADPSPRPRRASVLYRRSGGVWLANVDGKQNYRLKLADGQALSATWTPDGKTMPYISTSRPIRTNCVIFASSLRTLTRIGRFPTPPSTPASSRMRTAACSVAAPVRQQSVPAHVLVAGCARRARELTLCEHRASNPAMVSPIFSPNSPGTSSSPATSDGKLCHLPYRSGQVRTQATEEPPAAPERK